MAETTLRPLHFKGHRHLTQRLVLSTLTGRPLRITNIRSSNFESPGLAPHEVSFCRLLDSITNGSEFVFSETGTQLLYRPGLVKGSVVGYGADIGGEIKHELPATIERGVSWFLLPLCMLAPFAAAVVNVRFVGPGVITAATERGDVSVDTVRMAVLPMFEHFGISNRLEIRTSQRSCAGPDGKGGAGEVHVVFGHQVRLPKTVHLLNPGRVKAIRGVAYATGVAGANNARMIEAARGVLNSFVPDTRIFSENTNAGFVAAPTRENPRAKKKIGIGFGLCLVAETSTGMRYSADAVSPVTGGVAAEDIGKRCAYQLLEVIEQGGCASALAAPTMVTLMALGSEDVGRVLLGRDVVGSRESIQLARDFKEFALSSWGLRDAGDESEEGIVISIVGRGLGNTGRKMA